MRYFLITTFIVIVLSLHFFYAHAQVHPGTQNNGNEVTNVTVAVPFLLITPDARAGAMGEAGVAVLPDVNVMSINPSKLAYLNDPYGFSMSYSPWLNNLNSDMNFVYLSGYYKVAKNSAVGTSLRYFSLGEVQLFDRDRQDLGTYRPNEFALDIAYSRMFGESFSLGTAVSYIRSNLSSGKFSDGQETKPANALAVDVSGYVRNETILFRKDVILSLGINISNIGTKVSYAEGADKFFLPANLKLGGASTFLLDNLNQLTFALDFNKLLVPTQPVYDQDGKIIRGRDPNVSVPAGIFGSFNDAPGGAREEFSEVSIATGLEYSYNKQFAVRCGYFYEDPKKGDRRYFTTGVGLKYQSFSLDLAYLISGVENSPLANTLRFSLTFTPFKAGTL
ncbi:type IX secretion system outer membrane channel protein PorV [Pedobacter sp. PLR]|uniref:type IX secretion system outer membrane channel protein PorV n=1 Tax=Pedobacter sp. PLR TaxID=2994465 RepID=UPI002247BB63|nr:type IX secretion system outer membrane channel protein PorV [Pedobacter sp. PLR]MCX2449656.1 type IX secretion system outer membrane channel protein PorV [Pedobacter sp. PLR]